jgi:hypothetical protein
MEIRDHVSFGFPTMTRINCIALCVHIKTILSFFSLKPKSYAPVNFPIIICPKGVSKIVVLTNTVNTTPKISIITCIVVELWAGSTFILLKISGRTAPKQILVKTIMDNAVVTATVSAMGVLKAVARMNPATDKIALREHAILNSRLRNCLWVFSLSVPRAMPRMTGEICLYFCCLLGSQYT